MATAAERLAAYRTAFEQVLAAIAELEQTLGKSSRELRADGTLGEAVATASSAAHDGLRLVANAEQGRPG